LESYRVAWSQELAGQEASYLLAMLADVSRHGRLYARAGVPGDSLEYVRRTGETFVRTGNGAWEPEPHIESLPPLLVPDDVIADPEDWQDFKLGRTADCDGSRCYVLTRRDSAEDGVEAEVELWVSAADYLIRLKRTRVKHAADGLTFGWKLEYSRFNQPIDFPPDPP